MPGLYLCGADDWVPLWREPPDDADRQDSECPTSWIDGCRGHNGSARVNWTERSLRLSEHDSHPPFGAAHPP